MKRALVVKMLHKLQEISCSVSRWTMKALPAFLHHLRPKRVGRGHPDVGGVVGCPRHPDVWGAWGVWGRGRWVWLLLLGRGGTKDGDRFRYHYVVMCAFTHFVSCYFCRWKLVKQKQTDCSQASCWLEGWQCMEERNGENTHG